MHSKRRISAAVAAAFAIALVGAPSAHAAGWTKLHDNGPQGVLLACKTPEGGGYGPVWKVSLVLASTQANYHTSARVDVVRGGSTLIGRTVMHTWAPGAWDLDTTYASRLYGDRLVGAHGWGNERGEGGGGYFDVSMVSVTLC